MVVIKWSDGTFLEDQDHWYLPGLSRSVYLYSTPQAHIADLFAKSTLKEDLTTGLLDLELFYGVPELKAADALEISAKLYAPDGSAAWEGLVRSAKVEGMFGNGSDPARLACRSVVELPDVAPWSAEAPNLYTLAVAITDESGRCVDATSTRIGFRRYEVRRREFLVNGQPVRICGMNRHDHHDTLGKAVPYETMKLDLVTMKRFNVNAVRTCHYPNAPEFYDLCDELGFYVVDEANIEHHAFYNDLCRQSAVDRRLCRPRRAAGSSATRTTPASTRGASAMNPGWARIRRRWPATSGSATTAGCCITKGRYRGNGWTACRTGRSPISSARCIRRSRCWSVGRRTTGTTARS